MPPPVDSDTRIADLMRAYLVADYKWERGGHWHDILIGLPTPGLDLAYPDATSYGMLSAWNPHSVEREERINREQDELLQQELADSGHAFLPAFASAPNRTWREPSWLVFDFDAAAFDALSRRYGQLGTLWWRPNHPVRLRMLSPRPPGVPDEANVDWIE
jgi:hypothetical protein